MLVAQDNLKNKTFTYQYRGDAEVREGTIVQVPLLTKKKIGNCGKRE